MRSKLALVVERLLHGYDEEEICFALKMCSSEQVRVWEPGKPTSMSAGLLNVAKSSAGLESNPAEVGIV